MNTKDYDYFRDLNFTVSLIWLIVFCIPRNTSAYPILCQALSIIWFIGMIWAIAVFLKGRYYRIRWYFPLLALFFLMIICTLLNDLSALKTALLTICRMFSVTVLSEHLFVLDSKRAITRIAKIWALLLLIEAFSQITHCFGYTSTNNTTHLNNYLFGIRVDINQYVIYSFAFVCFAACLGNKKEKIIAAIAIISGLYFVIAEQVSTSIVGCATFFIVFFASKAVKNKKIWRFIVIFALAFVILFILFQDTEQFRWLLVDLLNEDITLNGRTILWNQAIKQIIDGRWMFGYGISPPYILRLSSSFVVNHPHNQYIQFVYNYGVCGLILYLIMNANMIKKIKVISDSRIRVIHIAVLIATFFMCLASRNFFYLTAQIYYVVVRYLDKTVKIPD